MTPICTSQKTVVIVNGFSSGVLLAPAFRARGISCVHLLSHAIFPDGIKSSKTADISTTNSLYAKTLVFEGDYNAIISALDKYTIIGVIPGMELAVPLADALSERMGLPTNGSCGSPARRDKFLMQSAVRDAGLPTKRYLCTDNVSEVLASTDGVRFCTSENEIREAFGAIHGRENRAGEINARILAEERLIGREFAVNSVSWDGKHRLAELWEYHKVRVEGAGNVYDCTRLQDWPDETLMPLIRYAFGVLDALGIRYGAAHTEIMLTENGPLLIESGARVMGGKTPPELVMHCIGQCQVDLLTHAYADPEDFMGKTGTPYKLRCQMFVKSLIAGADGVPSGEISAIDKLSGLASCVRGDFVPLISEWNIHRTVDLLTSPAKVFLVHEDIAVILADYQTIRACEQNHAQEFFGIGMQECG
jgi:hypothetical protein